jgi:hypothetical protein
MLVGPGVSHKEQPSLTIMDGSVLIVNLHNDNLLSIHLNVSDCVPFETIYVALPIQLGS